MMRNLLLPLVLFPAFAQAASASPTPTAAAVVRGFLDEVRSGRAPEKAVNYLAPEVRAHQVTAEGESVVVRSPEAYARHVQEFRQLFGDFSFTIQEFISDEDKVFVRWRQDGHHLGSLDGETPTGAPLTELTSVVYRVEAGKIAEYWLQTDRKGLELQLQRAK